MYLRHLFKHWTLEVFAPGKLLRQKYVAFKELLRHDKRSLELITDLEDLLPGERLVDWARVESLVRALRWSVGRLIDLPIEERLSARVEVAGPKADRTPPWRPIRGYPQKKGAVHD